jgi:Ni/Co efflux regulator RcnB
LEGDENGSEVQISSKMAKRDWNWENEQNSQQTRKSENIASEAKRWIEGAKLPREYLSHAFQSLGMSRSPASVHDFLNL